MILRKLWRTFKSQANKLANLLWTADPVAQMQYEYDLAVAQLKTGREGLEQYRALVERVDRQAASTRKHIAGLEARIQAYLSAGDRDTAARFALELERARHNLAENEAQLELQEQAYANNVTKIKFASRKLAEVRQRIAHHDSELKMSQAEAELAKLAGSFDFDLTTDFGQIEQVIEDKVTLNRGKVRVASDLSGDRVIDVEHEQAAETAMADQALRRFEKQLSLPPSGSQNEQARLSAPDPKRGERQN